MEESVDDEIGNEALPEIYREWLGSDPDFASLVDELPREKRKRAKDVKDSDGDRQYVSDKDVFDVVHHIKPNQWEIYYNIGLCGRLGLYCYNFQKGTNYKFKYVTRWDTRFDSLTDSLITLEAMYPADSSSLTFETLLKNDDVGVAQGVKLLWETCFCRVEGSKEADPNWDNEAINVGYKDELPKWFSNDCQQQRYVVKGSELLEEDNWWLHLFTEIAFYTKWSGTIYPRDLAECLPLYTDNVVVETRGEAATEPLEKLKAANAIFYINFICLDDPLTGKVAHYRAVIRKTMDGKPGHLRLEVSCWSAKKESSITMKIKKKKKKKKKKKIKKKKIKKKWWN